MGYPSLMILLPLILAAATVDPNVSKDAYRDCVVPKATEWATGPDSAEVIVRTAEGLCDGERVDVKLALFRFASEKEKEIQGGILRMTPKEFADVGTDNVVEGVRSLAFAAVLQARAKTSSRKP